MAGRVSLIGVESDFIDACIVHPEKRLCAWFNDCVGDVLLRAFGRRFFDAGRQR
jgi:hypothetical protein